MTTPTINTENEENLDIKKYFYLFLQKWKLFVLFGFIAIIVAFFVNRYSTPEYMTTNSVIITEEKDAMGAMGSIMQEFGAIGGGKAESVENKIEILTSYTLTKATLERLNYQVSYFHKGRINDVEIYSKSPIKFVLDTIYNYIPAEKINVKILSANEYELNIEKDSNSVKDLKLKFGEKFTCSDYDFSVVLKDNVFSPEEHIDETYFGIFNNYHDLTKSYLKSLTAATTSKTGSVIELTANGRVEEKIVDFLNTLILVAIENDLEEKNRTSYKTIEFIDAQLSVIVDSLQLAEENLEVFRSDNQIVDLSTEGSAISENLKEYQNQKSLLEIRSNYYEYLLKTIKDKNDFKDVVTPSVIGVQDPNLNNLVSSLSKLYAEKQVIEYSATLDNPSLQLINIQIKNTLTSLIENINNLIEASKIELKGLERKIALINNEIKKLPKTERELIGIQRKFQLNDNIYNYLLQKRAEVGITKAANLADIKFIDKAYIENVEQTAPKGMLNYLIALFLGCAIPGLLIIIKDFFNDKITDRSEVEQNSNIPILGSVSHNNRINEIIPVKKHPKSAIAESFRLIRANLAFFLKSTKTQTPILSFTSTISGEGKTFCALNLAGIIAMNNKRVLVVGLDLRKPKLHEMLKTNFSLGITNYLIGKNSMEDITIKTDVEGLDVILAGPIPPNPIELIESKEFENFIVEVNHLNYDYIIFDTPPIGLVADTISISKYSDLNVFVVRQNYTNKNSIRFINEVYNENKLSNLSILINDVDMLNSYGYKYRKHGNKHGYGYYENEASEKKGLKHTIKNLFS